MKSLDQLIAEQEAQEWEAPTYDDAAPIYYEDRDGDRAERLASYVSECDRCGSVVISTDRHTAWHRWLEVGE